MASSCSAYPGSHVCLEIRVGTRSTWHLRSVVGGVGHANSYFCVGWRN